MIDRKTIFTVGNSSFVILAFLLVVTGPLADALEKRSPPEGDRLAGSMKVVQEVYRNEMRLARTPEKKLALANKLLEEGLNSRSADNQYALLLTAKELYLESGGHHKAIGVIDELEERFEIDSVMLKYEILSDAASARNIGAFGRYQLAFDYQDAIRSALQKNDLKIALELAELAERSARKSGNRELADKMSELPAEVEQLADLYAKLEKLRETLKANSNDPEANLGLGEYLCLVNQEWEKGLPLLQKSSSFKLQDAAEQESSASRDPVKLGDSWWDAAESLSGLLKQYARLRAAHWYEMALPTVSGLDKAKIEQRLSECRPGINVTGKWVEPGQGSKVLAEDRHQGTAGGQHANNVYFLKLRSPERVNGLQIRVNGQMTHLATGTSTGSISISFDGEEWIAVTEWTAESCRTASKYGNWHELLLSSSEILIVDRLAVKFEYTAGSEKFDITRVAVAR